MTDAEKKAFLVERGWNTYYNPKYWVHPKTVANPEAQDYTDYGMSLDDAVRYEQEGRGPFPRRGMILFGNGAYQ